MESGIGQRGWSGFDVKNQPVMERVCVVGQRLVKVGKRQSKYKIILFRKQTLYQSLCSVIFLWPVFTPSYAKRNQVKQHNNVAYNNNKPAIFSLNSISTVTANQSKYPVMQIFLFVVDAVTNSFYTKFYAKHWKNEYKT